jgi:C4-dicarboxylate-specific signal transduction histidine kinase
VAVDVNAAIEERLALLSPGRPGVRYETELASPAPLARADADLVKGVLTNLLENAADAARQVLIVTTGEAGRVAIEVHDSGPGLSEQARKSLFEPTITFKKRGMGLGLSIARNNALLCGGDLELIESRLGGAGFRLSLPVAAAPALVPTRAAS